LARIITTFLGISVVDLQWRDQRTRHGQATKISNDSYEKEDDDDLENLILARWQI
jgi:hypothetical protein